MTFIDTYITKLAGAFFARSKVLLAIAGILLISLLVACAQKDVDGGADTYTVGGSISGNSGIVTLTLTYGDDEKTETLEVPAGTEIFTFRTKLVAGQSFTLDVTASPEGQFCQANIKEGKIVDSDINNVVLTCSDSGTTYTVSGTVSGLANGETITLTLTTEGATLETKEVTGDGDATDDIFIFIDSDIAVGSTFAVTTTSPAGKTCTVAPAGEQTMGDANVDDVAVTCVVAYSVSGAVSGLSDGETVTLTLFPTGGIVETKDVNGDTDETAADNFAFETRLAVGSTFAVTTTSPAGKACTVGLAGEQRMGDSDVTDVTVTCIPTHSVSGAVSGLANGETITLTLFSTGGVSETKDITGDGDESTDDNFAFDTAIAKDATYTVTTTSPAGKTCTVAPAGEQTMGDADVTDVAVTCVLTTYSLSGSVNGAADNSQITITLLHADSNTLNPFNIAIIDVNPNANGTFSFDVPENKYYLMTVASATANEVCIINNREFEGPITADRVTFTITCTIAAADTYSVGGTISGLANGEIVILSFSPLGDRVDRRVIIADTDGTTADNFTFNRKLANGATYFVTITAQPAGKICSVANAGRQTMGGADVTNVTVTCVPFHSISGTVTGAANNANTYVVLTLSDDNAGAGATRQFVKASAAGTFSFTGVPANKFYTLQASSSTAGETCSGGPTTPTLVTADVRGATITCTASTGPVIRIKLSSDLYEASATTVNVFIGDGAIPATTGTPTRVVNGSDTDVVIIERTGFTGDGFYYNIPIEANKY